MQANAAPAADAAVVGVEIDCTVMAGRDLVAKDRSLFGKKSSCGSTRRSGSPSCARAAWCALALALALALTLALTLVPTLTPALAPRPNANPGPI